MTFSTADLATRTIHRRAVEALIWGIPVDDLDLNVPVARPRL